MKSLVMLVFVVAGLGCGAETPVPDYPFTDPPPLEETDLARYVGGGEDYEDIEEDEEWDDGLDDADLEMDGAAAPEPSGDAAEAPAN